MAREDLSDSMSLKWREKERLLRRRDDVSPLKLRPKKCFTGDVFFLILDSQRKKKASAPGVPTLLSSAVSESHRVSQRCVSTGSVTPAGHVLQRHVTATVRAARVMKCELHLVVLFPLQVNYALWYCELHLVVLFPLQVNYALWYCELRLVVLFPLQVNYTLWCCSLYRGTVHDLAAGRKVRSAGTNCQLERTSNTGDERHTSAFSNGTLALISSFINNTSSSHEISRDFAPTELRNQPDAWPVVSRGTANPYPRGVLRRPLVKTDIGTKLPPVGHSYLTEYTSSQLPPRRVPAKLVCYDDGWLYCPYRFRRRELTATKYSWEVYQFYMWGEDNKGSALRSFSVVRAVPEFRGLFITGLSTMNGHSPHVITSRQEKSAACHNNKMKNGDVADRAAPRHGCGGIGLCPEINP
ncbi:hypothetical protein Bbelb_256350 [Branchiostoma belcheri]|nr:hypothetical protein Bbelb_256350 [Branchiostoma belcheri]